MFPGEGKRLQDIIYFLLNKMPNYIYQKFLCYSSRISEILCVLLKEAFGPGLNENGEIIGFTVLFTAVMPYINLLVWFFLFPYLRKSQSFAEDGRNRLVIWGNLHRRVVAVQEFQNPTALRNLFHFFHK